MIGLGDKVTDPLTKIKGIVTARTEYLYGCARCCVEFVKDGKLEEYWFDELRLEDQPPQPARGGGSNPTPRSGE